jgi:hypothetical protein
VASPSGWRKAYRMHSGTMVFWIGIKLSSCLNKAAGLRSAETREHSIRCESAGGTSHHGGQRAHRGDMCDELMSRERSFVTASTGAGGGGVLTYVSKSIEKLCQRAHGRGMDAAERPASVGTSRTTGSRALKSTTRRQSLQKVLR